MRGVQVPQPQILEPRIRLPLVQHPTEAIVDSMHSNMLSLDALRRGGTSRKGIAIGPLPAPQRFAGTGDPWPNSPASMDPGIRRTGNYGAGVGQGRGQSAGL